MSEEAEPLRMLRTTTSVTAPIGHMRQRRLFLVGKACVERVTVEVAVIQHELTVECVPCRAIFFFCVKAMISYVE